MRPRKAVPLALSILTILGALYAQKPFREFPGVEYYEFPLPADWRENTEFTRARLKCMDIGTRWGRRGTNWTIDYPRSDRHLLTGLRRLTRIHTRSVEQVVDVDDPDEMFNWPFLYAVEVGHWDLTGEEGKRLRDYLLHGGFLMVDDFHGTQEWEIFMAGMNKIFPDRPVVDLSNQDAIFHVLYDLDQRFQVPGAQYLYRGRTYERDGYEAAWRGIYDDKGRLMVAICHNMDLGDAWEWSDDPRYPEKYASLAYRIAVNYAIYALTH